MAHQATIADIDALPPDTRVLGEAPALAETPAVRICEPGVIASIVQTIGAALGPADTALDRDASRQQSRSHSGEKLAVVLPVAFKRNKAFHDRREAGHCRRGLGQLSAERFAFNHAIGKEGSSFGDLRDRRCDVAGNLDAAARPDQSLETLDRALVIADRHSAGDRGALRIFAAPTAPGGELQGFARLLHLVSFSRGDGQKFEIGRRDRTMADQSFRQRQRFGRVGHQRRPRPQDIAEPAVHTAGHGDERRILLQRPVQLYVVTDECERREGEQTKADRQIRAGGAHQSSWRDSYV